MFNKYRNEVIIIASAILLLIALLYSSSTYALFASKGDEVSSILTKKKDISTMNKLWQDKKIPKKLKAIEEKVPESKVSTFDIKRKSAHIVLDGLTGNELNDIVSKDIASIGIQIIDIAIDRDADKYKLEVNCKW